VLVARGGPPGEVFAAISEQAARVCGVGAANVVRFADSGAEIAGRHGELALDSSGALGLVRHTGLPARIEEVGGAQSAAAPVIVDDQVWGALVASGEQLTPDAEQRLSEFAQLAGLAVAGADARERLLVSRARLVTPADAERKRLERNLHDGAQQRLVAAQLALRMARNRLDAPELDPILDELKAALDDLRELARGLHPAALQRGLFAAVGALATRSPVPVEYDDVTTDRLPEPLEVAAYYVIAESLANAAKHADASLITVRTTTANTLLVEVSDNGRGGADFTDGSGLIGLRDRVEALRGRLRITSPHGAGTTVHAEFPLNR
jgi:signal transduction histidine kinase